MPSALQDDDDKPRRSAPDVTIVNLPVDEELLAALRLTGAPRPRIDEHGCLHLNDRWIAIPPIEARIMSVLIEGFDQVVSATDLATVAWPDGLSSASQLRVRILRLRRRLGVFDLELDTVRGEGYVLRHR